MTATTTPLQKQKRQSGHRWEDLSYRDPPLKTKGGAPESAGRTGSGNVRESRSLVATLLGMTATPPLQKQKRQSCVAPDGAYGHFANVPRASALGYILPPSGLRVRPLEVCAAGVAHGRARQKRCFGFTA